MLFENIAKLIVDFVNSSPGWTATKIIRFFELKNTGKYCKSCVIVNFVYGTEKASPYSHKRVASFDCS